MADRDDLEPGDDSSKSKQLRTALRRWKLAEEADTPQRNAELEDLKFIDDPDGMWPSDIRLNRQASTVGNVAVPARPTLTIDKITPAVDQVLNQASNARLSVKVKPKGGRASQKTADVLQGLYRNIEVESKAHRARMWALDRAAKVGRGYYRILTKYANDGDFDLDIVISRILNQHAVRLDPFHQEPDGSDAEWAMIAEDVPLDRFKQDYSESEFTKAESDEELVGLGMDAPEWVGGDSKESRTVRVAEYFYAKYTERTLIATSSGWKGFEDDPERIGKGKTLEEPKPRKVKQRAICWMKLTAADVLEGPREIDGRYIPIVQVLGTETNINGQRRYRGLVAKAKDANRMFNVMFSREMEAIGLATLAPWLIPEGSIEGHEHYWNAAATRNLPYLPYRLTALNGQPAPPPQRNVAEPAIQAISVAIAQAQDAIQATTKTFDPSLGKAQSRTQSGRAISELQQQSEQGNSHFLENLAQDAMAHEARIVLDLMKYVYDRQGRVAQILGEDDSPSEVMLNAPFTPDADGKPQMLTVPGPSGEMIPMPADQLPQGAQHYDLKEGEYAVTVSIGKSYSTLREESNAMMGQIAQAAPQLMPLVADLWIRSMDFPQKDEIADRLKKMLPPQVQDVPEGQQPDPQQLMAQNQQLQMQMQQMGAELQKAQSKMDVAELNAQTKLQIEQAKLAHDREMEELKARVKQIEAMARVNAAELQSGSAEARDAMKVQADLAKHAADLQNQREMADNARLMGGNGDRG